MAFSDRGIAIRVGGGEYGEEAEGFLEEEERQKVGEIGKLPSSQYKGVVPQPNGRWGAQIYEKHQRVWLGTYDSEKEAARSYDLAAIRFRGREAITNFKSNDSFFNTTKMEFIQESAGLGHRPETVGNAAGDVDTGEREHMFDKVVTPSDVGKLNRLVIPKQHAEKYFPLDSSSNEKGLLLNFEDNTGKPWRFRYSYWNSSQSYVMTKGWSRFVKEKKLDAGDTVSFERGVGQAGKDRLYIGWKRRPEAPQLPRTGGGLFGSATPWGQFFWPTSAERPIPHHHHHHLHEQQQQHQQQLNYDYCNHNYYGYCKNNVMLQPQQLLDPRSIFYLAPQQVGGGIGVHGGEGMVGLPTVFDSVPVVHEKAATKKRLRLFGVNLECPVAMEDDRDRDGDGDGLSSATDEQQPNWFSHTASPSQLQLRLYNGAGSQLPLPTVPPELPSKARPSWSFDLEP